MLWIIIIGIVSSCVCAGFWLMEIYEGMRKSYLLRQNAKGISKLMVPFGTVFCFKEFGLDLAITTAFTSFFGLSGITGWTSAMCASNIFSIAIIIKTARSKNKELNNNTQLA